MTLKRVLQAADFFCVGCITLVTILSGAQGSPVMANLIWLAVAGFLLAIAIDVVLE